MKKIFSILLTGSILVMTTSSKTSAQRIRNSSYSESNFENVRNPLGSSHRSVMSAKAVRDFSKTFKKAVDTKWYETPNGSIVYFFTMELK